MAQVCSSSPTLTSTQEIRTQAVFTTFSPVVSTIPASTISSTVTESCGNSTCPETVIVTEVPARTTTSQVPVVITSQSQTFSVATFWGTNCARSSNDQPSSTPPPSTSTTTTSALLFTPSTTSPSTSLSTSSPSPFQSGSQTVITSIAVSTMPNGVVVSQTLTITTLLSEQTTIISTASHGDSGRLSRIVGCAIGGAAALGILVLVVWYILKKRLAARSGLAFFFERVTPAKGYRQFDGDRESFYSPGQPLGGDQQGTQQTFINLEQRQPNFPSQEDPSPPHYDAFGGYAQGSQLDSHVHPNISHPHLLPQDANPFASHQPYIDSKLIQPPQWTDKF